MAKKTPEKKWKSEEIVELLEARFCPPEYATFTQVAQGTGMYSRSWIDVASFNLWPSKSLRRSAYEIKVSRQDFMSEIRNPNKNAWAKECFHEFWFVTAPGVVKKDSEIPEGAGWMQATKGGLRVKLQARVKEEAAMDEVFFASLCRSAANSVDKRMKNIEQEILSKNVDYKRAIAWREAGMKFLRANGGTYVEYLSKEDEILKKLETATLDSKSKQDRDHILGILEKFQRRMIEMSDLFTVISAVGLIERDELGKYIIGRYGGEDEGSLAHQRTLAKDKSYGSKDYVEMTERLLERAKGLLDEDRTS